ncbi:SDR family NAD(P)-dependent oxidoreductase [Erwinia amylovora]|uniref:type I polyketide synthase n=1 Tax=Erwinia amylovora TaxID=552 RepID=UPI0020BE9A57|nr:type I polyketide synthase [Erwinia amylovora]MCK8351684.1 SDR family NAD(P)-dependent oxidoreductase [Erwinia amylovora]MCK8355080.1 SDR family NAD(P)-dependent oxidoreductase [Erwinia amylovora]
MNVQREYAGVLALILEQLAVVSGVPEVDEDERLGNIALDSVKIIHLVASLGLHLGVELDPTLFWTCPTPAELARHIAGNTAEQPVEMQEPEGKGITAEPLAITGLACRFPGARDANAYWDLLIGGKGAVATADAAHFQEIPDSPWHIDPNEIAGFLDEASAFDFEQFGISAHEASCMDPQQRVLLELSWAAIEQAGISPKKIKGQRVGVYVGAMWCDFAHHVVPDKMTAQSATGMDTSILSARLSFVLGLTGPSLTVNTACSSSLVALHLACQAIRNNDCDFAIVAGVNLLLAAQSFAAMRRFGGLSETGLCRTFDAAADGYIRAEGCGVVVVRPLSRVLQDAGPVWGIIRSSVVNNNGYHASLTAPSVIAQQQLLRAALVQAKLQPSDIQYVEAHGTGTAMGDPIEVSAISAAYCQGAARSQPLLIGSVKTHIGHSEAAAGMAGLIKVLLAMRYRIIPAHLNYQTPNPSINWQKLGLQLVTGALPWETANPVAGVSSFGFGGTNAHIIVSETWHCRSFKGVNSAASKLMADKSDFASLAHSEDGRALLIFSGQGAHWQGMGRSYARLHPQFRKTVAQCDRCIQQLRGWSLAERLYDERETFADVRVAWPCHLVMQLAISDVWLANGLQPGGVIGHSIGEIAAAHVAGLISREDALHIILAQAEWAHRHPGSMALVKLDWAAAQTLLEQQQSSACCAIQHDENATVITGSVQALRDIESHCQRKDISFKWVNTAVSVHRQIGDDDRQQLIALLGDLPGSAALLPFYSGIYGGELLGRLPADYWSDTIGRPLYWFDALRQAVSDSDGPLVEVAPHSVLSSSINNLLIKLGSRREVLFNGHRSQPEGSSLPRALQRYPHDDPWHGLHLLLLSGHSVEALSSRCVSIARWLDGKNAPGLRDCARALVHCTDDYRYRVALIVSSHKEAVAQLLDIAHRAGSVASNADNIIPSSLVITDQAPFDEQMCSWLRRFKTFCISYSCVMLAGQDRQIASPMLEAAAQQLGCVALLAEWGVSFDHYDATDHACCIAELIERRVTRNEFISAVASSNRVHARPVVAGDRHSVHISLPSPGQHASCADQTPLPARAFLELVSRCYLAGKSVDHIPGGAHPPLTLPAMFYRSAGLPPSAETHAITAQKPVMAYRLVWQKKSAFSTSHSAQQLLVFAQPGVQAQLQARHPFSNAAWCSLSGGPLEDNAAVSEAAHRDAADFAALFAGRSIETVVFIWGDSHPLVGEDPSLNSALMLLQYIQSMPGGRPTLLFVTLGAQAVTDSKVYSPNAAMAWGLIRTAQRELADVQCLLVDIDPPGAAGALSEYAIDALCMSLGAKRDQSAWRAGQLFSPGLVELTDVTPASPLAGPPPPGFHLITGGLGALGLELLQALFNRGERRFVLLGRTLPEHTDRVIVDLREAGADILLHSCDVTCLESLHTLVRQSAHLLGPLTAITHAAGVLQADSLATVSQVDFAAGLAAKKIGALNLHIISAEWPLKRFVLVSSVSSLFGFPQFASYAVANAYLDGLIGYRQTHGLPALGVCYGPFLGKGLLEKQHPAMDFPRLAKISISEGLEALSACSSVQGVLAIMRYSGPLALGRSVCTPAAERPQYALQERHARLCAVIRRGVATLLQQPGQQIPLDTPLSELGVSSLLGVEVRNRLQSELSVRMPATVLWNYPTVSSLASYLETLLWPECATPYPTAHPVQTNPLVGAIDDSEEALMAQLLDELAIIKSTYI